MKRDIAIRSVRLAIDRASLHLAGDRDRQLCTSCDLQIERFLVILRKMESSLIAETSIELEPQMMRAIADGWPLNSELGNLIATAEDDYFRVEL